MHEYFFSSLIHVFDWMNILCMALGVGFGIIVGALPGLSVTMGVSLMLPLTYGMNPTAAILMLIGVYCGGIYAGSISAILLNNPGTVASAATAADGYQLAQKGKADLALNTALYSSVIGAFISGVVLLVSAPQIAKFALRFGPPEYFMLAVFGLTIIAGVSGKSLSKGLVMASLGLLFATVGLDPVSAMSRFSFGTVSLLAGIDLIPALIGLFAISEIFNQAEKGVKKLCVNTDFEKEKFSFKTLLPFKKTILRGSLLGVMIGAIPGTGGAIASFLSYNEARRVSKDPDSFGKGSLDGIAASESANNGVTGATLIPMMTLGIPGDTVTAVLLGALMIQGLSPGPQLFTQNADIAYTVMIGFLVVNIILFIEGKFAVRLFAKVLLVPANVLLPIVMGFCLIGAYAVSNNMYSVIIALFFGVIGYILPKFGYPTTPMLIALILGPLAEKSLMQSLIMSDGSFLIFVTRPISIVFFVFVLTTITFSIVRMSGKGKIKISA